MQVQATDQLLHLQTACITGCVDRIVGQGCQDTLNPKAKRSPTNKHNQTRERISLIDLGVLHLVKRKTRENSTRVPRCVIGHLYTTRLTIYMW